MDEERLASLTLEEFGDRLASAEPVPGGGSASALAGSLAASLLSMVARLSADRPKYAEFAATHARALEFGEAARRRLLDLAEEDARVYAEFSAARKLPRDTEEQQQAREAASRAAARDAAEVPLRVVRECARLMDEIEAMAGRSNLNAASDLAVGARLASAAARGAAANVIINLPMVGDEAFAESAMSELHGLLEIVERQAADVAQRATDGGLREPEAG